MKNRKMILIIILLFFLLILVFLYYKFQNKGNTINNKEDLENKFLNISNYKASAKITVTSNKTVNSYNINQIEKPNYSYEEILNEENIVEMKIELDNEVLKITNMKLNLEKVFKDYKNISDNILFLSTVIKDYLNEENEKEIIEEENEFIISVNLKNNKYIKQKKLYINKVDLKPTKMIVLNKDKKEITSIIYTNMEIY